MKLITISPGGYRGYYLLGVTTYLKTHFDTRNCIFSGASAGAWLSLMMTYHGNHSELLENLNLLSPDLVEMNLKQIQQNISQTILEKYTTKDFDLKRLAVGVSHLHPFYLKTCIYTDFRDLKDAVECCKASSHIPFITAGMFHVYEHKLAFDGGFSIYPYLNAQPPILHICTDIWEKKHSRITKLSKNMKWNFSYLLFKNIHLTNQHSTLFPKEKYNLTNLYVEGYQHTANNHAQLAKLFPRIFSPSFPGMS